VIEAIAKGLGLAAADAHPFGPGDSGSVGGYTTLGNIPLVGSAGIDRSATYRGIYLTNPWVWAAVNMISRSVARLPIQVYDLDERGRKTRIRGDVPLTPGRPTGGQSLDRLLDAPHGRISRSAQMRTTLVDRLVLGNALWEIERDAFGAVTALPRLKWRTVRRVHEGYDGSPMMYEVQEDQRLQYVNSERRFLTPDEVIHFGLAGDTEQPMGTSPLEACRHTIALYDAIMRHLVAYMANSMRPSGNLKIDSVKLTRDRAKEIRDMLTELYTSPENAGKIFVSTGDFQSMSDTADHAQLVELIHNSREEIATVYAIPPPMLGILDRAIKSNVKELREQYIRDSVGPWANEIEQEFQAQLLPAQRSWSSLFVEFQLAEQLRPDLEARALVYQRLMSVFSIDEIRGFENTAPLDLAGISDVPWVQSGAMPITRAGESKGLPAGTLPGPAQPAGPAETGDDALAGAVKEVAGAMRASNQTDPELIALLAAIAERSRSDEELMSTLMDALLERPDTDPELLSRLADLGDRIAGLAERPIEVTALVPAASNGHRKVKTIDFGDGRVATVKEEPE
jgi:HK97 family phage portal protein